MKVLSERAARTAPYTAGEQPRDRTFIKLNTNENPYPPSPEVERALRAFDSEALKKYPDPDAAELSAAIAERFRTEPENVFVGNGSDEVLSLAFAAFFDEGDRVAFADVTYSFYPVYASFYGLKTDLKPLKNLRLDPADYFFYDGRGIVLCNPNAPTGAAVPIAEIEEIVRKNRDSIVILDEAYADFAEEDGIPLFKKFDNLLIVRTFSKSYALAGARLGYALGAKPLTDALRRVKNSFNSYTVNRLTAAAGLAALSDRAYFAARVKDVIKTREATRQELLRLGFFVPESAANFLFVEVGEGKRYYTELKKSGVLVRFFDRPGLDRFLRVTIGTDAEMRVFLRETARLRTLFSSERNQH